MTNFEQMLYLLQNEHNAVLEAYATLDGENNKLREALEFYADKNSWAWLGDGMTDPKADRDGGDIARKALGREA